jgi:DNA-cytosine methyltransferase
MNVLSLFDGMSAGQVALEKAGIKVDNYYASEIDKYAIAVTQYNYPNTTQLGDITKVRYENGKLYSNIYPDGLETVIDIVIGGSPCQGLSFSGKMLAFDDPRSKLYFEFERLVQQINPIFWLLENVQMKKVHSSVITERLGFDFIKIDSAILSAQSRKRFYWSNIPNIKQPEDRCLHLEDFIESVTPDSIKSYAIDANYFKGGNLKQYFEKSRRQLVFDNPVQVAHIGENQQGRRVYHPSGKSVTLKAQGGGWGAKTGLYILPVTFSRHQELSGKILDKSLPIESSNWRGLNRNQRQTAILKMLETGELIIRKLTPVECERLQTFPDNYSKYGCFGNEVKPISNTQRYKMLGNAFTVDVITHILSYISEKD